MSPQISAYSVNVAHFGVIRQATPLGTQHQPMTAKHSLLGLQSNSKNKISVRTSHRQSAGKQQLHATHPQ